jgi:hypothetical protein
MAWDSSRSSTRRRQNSNAASKPAQSLNRSTVAFQSKSNHVADPALQPFLNPSFDPAEYLNATLPSLQTSAVPVKGGVPVAELSTQTQTLLSQLSAQSSRLTTVLNGLVDEILRSGSRLAYETEVLRGEVIGLQEALTEGLQEDLIKFVPGGLEQNLARRPSRNVETNGTRRRASTVTAPKTPIRADPPPIIDPPYITQLRTLTLVRSRLDEVIKTFGDAMGIRSCFSVNNVWWLI